MNARKILGYALGPIGSAAFGIVSLPLISWYFPAEDIGRIVLLQTVSSLSILILGLGLDQAYIREYYASEHKASLFKSLSYLPCLFIAAVTIIIALWNAAWPSEIVFSLNNHSLGILFLVFLATSLFARFLALILRMQERAVAFSFSQLTPKFFILVFVLAYVVLSLPTNTVSLVFAYSAAQVITVAVLIFQTKTDLRAIHKAPLSADILKSGLKYGMPLAIGNLAYWGFTSVDRFALKELASLEELGVYSMAVSFGAVALIFQSVFSTIWAPLVFKWVKENTNLDKIGGITLSMTALISGIVCFVGIFSPVVTWILPKQYAPVQFILLSSMLFPLLYTLTEVSGIGLNVVRKTWLITLVNLVAFACNFSLLHLLIPSLGARGAAMASAISFWLFFICKTELSSLLWQPLPRLKIYSNVTVCLLICLSYTYWGNSSNYWLFAIIWLIGLIVLVMSHKQQLANALQMIKGRLKKNNN
ncbi:lipopolysaccharide biosynthesis protein [Neisseria perflava]|uniref:lipopolysaccharide biosynthesis protein n=1 Tax=Neisseria perflava TaxID=33053 RepID=UPI00209E0531|nr:oligosaccharide flippase family protein [Neisseria perflava]MCP1659212.1 O-antigen/teichoic acid export membrane protein [Neisseria perflava]